MKCIRIEEHLVQQMFAKRLLRAACRVRPRTAALNRAQTSHPMEDAASVIQGGGEGELSLLVRYGAGPGDTHRGQMAPAGPSSSSFVASCSVATALD